MDIRALEIDIWGNAGGGRLFVAYGFSRVGSVLVPVMYTVISERWQRSLHLMVVESKDQKKRLEVQYLFEEHVPSDLALPLPLSNSTTNH